MLTIGADLDPCLGDLDNLKGDASNELNSAWDRPEDWLKKNLSKIKGKKLMGAVITPSEKEDTPCIKLYGSGSTRHISPYKSNFTSY